jgi:hypothetical protein
LLAFGAIQPCCGSAVSDACQVPTMVFPSGLMAVASLGESRAGEPGDPRSMIWTSA